MGRQRKWKWREALKKSKLLVVGATTERVTEIVEVGGTSLEQMQQFKYLGCTTHEKGKSTAEVYTRVGMAKAAMTKLFTIWKSKQITFLAKIAPPKICGNIRAVIWRRNWTHSERIEKKVNACETWCYRRMLGIKWTDKRTNESLSSEHGRQYTAWDSRAGKREKDAIVWSCHETSRRP